MGRTALALLMGLVLLLLAGCQLGGTPRLVVDPVVGREATVRLGERALLEIPIRNEGSAPLQIQDVMTSCGCTAASLTAREIPPGGQAILRVYFDSTFHNSTGTFRRQVFLTTNDPQAPQAQVEITVTVLEP